MTERYIVRSDRLSDGFCFECGKKLPPRRRKYCSDFCRTKQDIRYNQGLVSLAIFIRDHWKCQKCGKHFHRASELQCDHITAIALGGDLFDPSNLQTLCIDCHKEKTGEDIREIRRLKNKEKEEEAKKNEEEKQTQLINSGLTPFLNTSPNVTLKEETT